MSDEQYSYGTLVLGKIATRKYSKDLAQAIHTEEERAFQILTAAVQDRNIILTIEERLKAQDQIRKEAEKNGQTYGIDLRTNYIADMLDKKLKAIAYTQSHYMSDSHNISSTVIQKVAKTMLEGKKLSKKDFLITKLNATSFISRDGDLHLGFNPDEGTVVWNVSECNHAHDAAVASFLGKTFLSLMKDFEWSQRTGGTIFVHSEYDDEDGVMNSPRVAFSFGGLGLKETQVSLPKSRVKPY